VFHRTPNKYIRQFENNLRLLKEYTNVVSLDDFIANNLSYKKINIVITFDDGYKEWVSVALPVLKKYGLKATFFISSGLLDTDINKQNNINLYNSLITERIEPLSVIDLIKLKESGNIIGGHTVHHISLNKEKNLSIIEREILEDKLRLEEIIQAPVEYFAYPFGHVGSYKNTRKILEKCNYRAAVSLIPGFNSKLTDRFCLHRDLVRSEMDKYIFLSVCLGNKDFALFLRKFSSFCQRY
jgi:peptidoglycan/xylan/chitin deacetylase (PgdA/CDA1 family)